MFIIIKKYVIKKNVNIYYLFNYIIIEIYYFLHIFIYIIKFIYFL